MKSEFSTEHEPYTLFEIAESLGIPYKRLHYCYKVLSQREATKDKVKALDGRRPLQFSAATANLITRNCSALKRARKAEEKKVTAQKEKTAAKA
jgi:hypothetical protein